jgi:rRNA maturation endonuclease Nob1
MSSENEIKNDENERPVQNLIVDSSVLIKRAPLKVKIRKINKRRDQNFLIFKQKIKKDLADTVYCVSAVIDEIRDENTRASLQILPYEFKLKEPTSDASKFVANFARKTGDYANLSAVDLQLISLSYQLCKETMEPEEFANLNLEPLAKTVIF